MAISVTNIGIATAGPASGTTLAVSVGAGGVPVGATIVVGTSEAVLGVTTGGSISDGTNSYSTIAQESFSSGSFECEGTIFYAYNVSAISSGASITYNKISINDCAMSAFYVTGLASGDPLDSAATATANGSSTTPSVTSGTPGTANDLFVAGIFKFGKTDTFTEPSGGWATPFVEAKSGTVNNAQRVNGGFLVVTGTPAKTYGTTFTSTGAWAAIITAFKPGPPPSGSLFPANLNINQAVNRASTY